MTPTELIALVLLGGPAAHLTRPAPEATAETIRAAVTRSVALLEKTQAEYLKHRDCFSCHHQGVPTFALTLAKTRGFAVNDAALRKQLELTAKHLRRGAESYKKGQGQGGQVDTAGTALWALELGGWKADATTEAVAEYLLLRDKDRGHWNTSSKRPPSEASHFTATYLAVRGLRTFATAEQKERAQGRVDAARDWLAATPGKDTEDRVFRLWGLKHAGADDAELKAAAKELLSGQRPDGGWSQTDGMASDPYATGTVLVALHDAGGLAVDAPAYRRGLRYLLREQLADGSWYVKSRSRPFQTYFESGFPHRKDQFISASASAWATAALTLALPAK